MWLAVASGTAESRKVLAFATTLAPRALSKPLVFARLVRNRVGAVKRIVKAAPARIGGVQRVARIGEGHHQLRSADPADFLVDIRGLDLLRRRLRQQVADLLEERGVGVHVERLALVGAVPAVDFRLQGVAHREQFAVFRSEIPDDGGEPRPESVGRNPGFRAWLRLAMKSNRTGAIFNPWASTRFMLKLSTKNGVYTAVFGAKTDERREGGVPGSFSAKIRALRRLFASTDCANNGR